MGGAGTRGTVRTTRARTVRCTSGDQPPPSIVYGGVPDWRSGIDIIALYTQKPSKTSPRFGGSAIMATAGGFRARSSMTAVGSPVVKTATAAVSAVGWKRAYDGGNAGNDGDAPIGWPSASRTFVVTMAAN